MNLKFIFLGKKSPEAFDTIINSYLVRLNSYSKCDVVYFHQQNDAKLEQKVLRHIKSNSYFIVLDERGGKLDTLTYANFLQKKMLIYSDIIFLVGNAYGISKKILNNSDYLLSISKMTFTHLISRLILIEQTYRAFTILNHHPYHHE